MTDLKEIEAEAAAWLEEGAHATDDISQLLATADGGPGKSAAQYSHFWMLRKVQRGYACFDAYARISLTVSAQQLLLVGAYYAIALFMTKTEGWPEPSQNPATGWLSSATAAFAGCILYKLDRKCLSKCLSMPYIRNAWPSAGPVCGETAEAHGGLSNLSRALGLDSRCASAKSLVLCCSSTSRKMLSCSRTNLTRQPSH